MENFNIQEASVTALREAVRPYLAEKRYVHTLGVEKEAELLGREYLPERVNELRCAALLHDITKKLSTEEQIALCKRFSIPVDCELLSSPKLFHALTAAALIKADFPEYADDGIVSAVRYHTTGRMNMTTEEAIVYLADYIEENRTFKDCVELRRYFYDRLGEAKNDEEKRMALLSTLVLSFDYTMKALISEGAPIDRNTVDARNFFFGELSEMERKNERLK